MKTPQIIMATGICVLCAIAMVTAVLGQSELKASSNQQAAIIELSQPTAAPSALITTDTTQTASSTEAVDTNTSSSDYDTQATGTITE